MKILIDMGHPAHVHFFKHFIWEMEKRGHDIKVTARDKEVTKQLLDAYSIPYQLIGKPLSGKFSLLKEWVFRGYKIYKTGIQFEADHYLGILNPATAISAKFAGKSSITFTDTEHAAFAKRVTFPFSNIIITPSCYRDNLGRNQVCYIGFHELAYLHPRYFTPNPKILEEIGLPPDEHFIIVRFVSWQASHDVGQYGIRDKVELVKELEKYGRVLITSEGALPDELKSNQILVSPEKIHDLLYYATLSIGEGATMASESAVLGTPSIFISSLVGTMGNFIELEETYGLLYSFTNDNAARGKAVEILQNPESKEIWRIKRERLLMDKIDVTAFMVWFIENFPRSFVEMKEHIEVQYSCSSDMGDAS